jgi:hypothetical protein
VVGAVATLMKGLVLVLLLLLLLLLVLGLVLVACMDLHIR